MNSLPPILEPEDVPDVCTNTSSCHKSVLLVGTFFRTLYNIWPLYAKNYNVPFFIFLLYANLWPLSKDIIPAMSPYLGASRCALDLWCGAGGPGGGERGRTTFLADHRHGAGLGVK